MAPFLNILLAGGKGEYRIIRSADEIAVIDLRREDRQGNSTRTENR